MLRRQLLKILAVTAGGIGLSELLGPSLLLGTTQELGNRVFLPIISQQNYNIMKLLAELRGACGFCSDRAAFKTADRERGYLWYPADLRTIYDDPASLLTYDEWMANMAEAGVNLIRLRLTGQNRHTEHGTAGAVDFEPPPHGTYNVWHSVLNPNDLAQYRADQVSTAVDQDPVLVGQDKGKWQESNLYKLVDAAERHGVGLWITLSAEKEFDSEWRYHAWNRDNYYINKVRAEEQDRGFLADKTEVFTNPLALEAMKARIQFVVDLIGDSEAVKVWEIGNELTVLAGAAWWGTQWGTEHINENVRGAMVPWFREVARFIKDVDSEHRPVASSHVRVDPDWAWSSDPDDYWNVVNEIHDVPAVDIVAARGYSDSVAANIGDFRMARERFPHKMVVVGEYWPFPHGEVPVKEDPPFLDSKQFQWVCACGGGFAMRWVGIEEIEVNSWKSGGYADPQMQEIVGITSRFNDCVNWKTWSGIEDWSAYIGTAETKEIFAQGDGRHVAMMIEWTDAGEKSVRVDGLEDGQYQLDAFDWVTGEQHSSQSLEARSGALSFVVSVHFERNILAGCLTLKSSP
jgi:hypothetical protein